MAAQMRSVKRLRSPSQLTTAEGMEAAAALSRALTDGRSEMTATMRYDSAESMRAWRFEPEPETKTAMSMRSDPGRVGGKL